MGMDKHDIWVCHVCGFGPNNHDNIEFCVQCSHVCCDLCERESSFETSLSTRRNYTVEVRRSDEVLSNQDRSTIPRKDQPEETPSDETVPATIRLSELMVVRSSYSPHCHGMELIVEHSSLGINYHQRITNYIQTIPRTRSSLAASLLRTRLTTVAIVSGMVRTIPLQLLEKNPM
jgi:hypothetical protein